MVRPARLPRTVVVLGIVSFLNDLASEIVTPLIPILLSTLLGAGPVVLGLIEGVADAVAAFLKLWSGRRSDLAGGRRKGLALAGYALSNIARPLLALATSWGAVLLLRGVDRIGKGLRSAPRDALVADATPASMRGYAFGFQRAMDNAGAVLGSLVAAAALAFSQIGLTQVIFLSAIPGALAVMCVAFVVRDQPRAADADPTVRVGAPVARLAWAELTAPMRRYLIVLGMYTLARASEIFILLLGHQRGAGTVELLVLWAALSAAKSVTSTLGGRVADRVSRGAVLVLSWSAFAVSFALLALLPGQLALWLITIGYGAFAGFGEGAERAVIGDHAHERERGTAFGWYNLVIGIAAVPAGLWFGALWQYQGATAAFLAAAALAALSALLLRTWGWPAYAPGSREG